MRQPRSAVNSLPLAIAEAALGFCLSLAATLRFAGELEDVDAIPRWIEILSPSTVLLYEVHRPWREMFRLPYVDLEDYAAKLSARFRRIQFSAVSTTVVRRVH